MDYSNEYIQEIIGQVWEEVEVHGAREIAERLGVSEACVRELAPEQARAHDEAHS